MAIFIVLCVLSVLFSGYENILWLHLFYTLSISGSQINAKVYDENIARHQTVSLNVFEKKKLFVYLFDFTYFSFYGTLDRQYKLDESLFFSC